MGRIKEKIAEIEGYLDELEEFMPDDIDEYLHDAKTRAACERYFEKITEAMVDLAFLIIKDKGLKQPEDDKEAFDALAKEKIISNELAGQLKNAKGMRNIIAHQYGTVDNEIVFHSITEELVEDAENFLKSISRIYKK
ncbi:MAG: DUF86 domain-containing protein [Candidatus Nanoarchaeia archaeon]|nr:DUF86 domain-containing protein [Candidatus Nanoarchaeia archaeon]